MGRSRFHLKKNMKEPTFPWPQKSQSEPLGYIVSKLPKSAFGVLYQPQFSQVVEIGPQGLLLSLTHIFFYDHAGPNAHNMS